MQEWHGSDLQVVDALAVAVIVMDLTGTVTAWNSAAKRCYGWSEQEAIGTAVTVLLPFVTRADDTDEMIASLGTGGSGGGEWEIRAKTGETIWVRVTVTPLLDDEGAAVGSVSVSVPIAAEIAARRATMASERRFRALVEHAVDGIAVLDVAGIVTYGALRCARRPV